MSDAVPIGGVNLEDDGPEIARPTAATPPPPEAPAPPAEIPPEETPAEVDAVEVGGHKYTPVAALISERQKRQSLEAQVKDRDQLQAWVTANKPYVDFLQANPQLLQPRTPDPAPAPAAPHEDPEALETAKLMDFWTSTGEPDVKRGAAHLELVRRQAQRIAQQTLQPLETQSLQDKSNTHFSQAMRILEGKPSAQTALRDLWQQAINEPGGLKTVSDPRSASALVLMALGADVAHLQTPATPAAVPAPGRPPVETEATGNTPGRVSLSPLETRLAAQRKMTPTQWANATKGFVSGRSMILEDD